MINEAIKKINDEMQKQPDNKYLEIIGHYVIDHCNNEENAKKILDKGKNLSGAMRAVTAEAKKEVKNNIAVLEDNRVFEIVDKYFGFSSENEKKQTSSIDIDFESFI